MKHFVFAGRYGDICHSLPAVYEYAKRTGTRPRFTAAKEFAGILDGCGYLEPHAAPVPWARINEVVAWARSQFPQDEFVVMACYGLDYSPGYNCWSYLRDSWRLSQCPFPPETLPLVFDRRNAAREQKLVEQCLGFVKRPFALVALAGKSSPFAHPQEVIEDIKSARPDLTVVDISGLRAERVFDVIALMERASLLVTIDTLHLHMSAAVPKLPVYAFVCDGPSRWNRSDWRPQQVFRCNYFQYMDRRLQFREALKGKNSTPKIVHVWNDYEPSNPDTLRRMRVAQDSWKAEFDWAGNWQTLPLGSSVLPRTFADNGELAYVKDLIDAAASRCVSNDDVISLSNSDVGCVSGITGQVVDTVREFGCAFTHRHDGQRIEELITSEFEVGKLSWYPGSDWFFMSKGWWLAHRDEMPDMVVGREFWDAVLRQIMKKHGTREIFNAVWHEKHVSLWEQPQFRRTLAGNVHNAKFASEFFLKNKSNANDPFRNTWNIQPGITQDLKPKCNMVEPTRKARSSLVFANRFQIYQNQRRLIQR